MEGGAVTANEASLKDAYAEGQRIGRMGFGPEMNTYAEGTPEREECEKGRIAALGFLMCGLARSVC